jgi:hypothetical protein
LWDILGCLSLPSSILSFGNPFISYRSQTILTRHTGGFGMSSWRRTIRPFTYK